MTKLKGWAALLLALALAVGLAACGADGSAPPDSAPAAATSAPPTPASDSEPETPPLEPLPLAESINALTGQARPEGMEAGARPVAVIVANNQRSLPQRGLAAADVLVETLTEGGITRLMALYADARAIPQVGPVRSTRDQFVQLAAPLDAIQVHIGTSVYARNLLTVLEEKDIDGLYLGRTAFYFDTARSLPRPGGKLNEYCWFTDAGLIATGVGGTGVPTTGEVRALFNFAAEPAAASDEAAQISVAYSDQSTSGFNYNTETGLYDKTIFGSPHMDEDGTPLSYTNVLLLGTPITLKEDGLCSEFDFRGSTGWYFTAGGVTPITWQKGRPEDALRLFTDDGQELQVQPGKTYIGLYNENRPDSLAWAPPTPAEPPPEGGETTPEA